MRSSNPPLVSRQQVSGLGVVIGSSGMSKRKDSIMRKVSITRMNKLRRKSQLSIMREKLSKMGEDVQIEKHPNQKEIFNLLWMADFALAQAEGLL